MGIREDRYVDSFYARYQGRIAVGVGYAQNMKEIFPLVFEDDEGKPLGIVAMASLSDENMHDAVHVFHLSVFKSRSGGGSAMLNKLCRAADQLNVALSLSPIPSPNGEAGQINRKQLCLWYRKFGFRGDSLLIRFPEGYGGD